MVNVDINTKSNPQANIARDIAAIRWHVRLLEVWIVRCGAIILICQLVFATAFTIWAWRAATLLQNISGNESPFLKLSTREEFDRDVKRIEDELRRADNASK